jgi:glycopeptide antibiotics resistance protein
VLRKLYLVCLGAYCLVIAWVTLRSFPYPSGSFDYIPFLDTWQQMRDYGDRSALREVAGNFALFVPLGLLLQASFGSRRNVTVALAIAATTSIAIEAWQGIAAAGRHPSLDDVLYNTAGGLTGAIIFMLVRGAVGYRAKRARAQAPAGRGD